MEEQGWKTFHRYGVVPVGDNPGIEQGDVDTQCMERLIASESGIYDSGPHAHFGPGIEKTDTETHSVGTRAGGLRAVVGKGDQHGHSLLAQEQEMIGAVVEAVFAGELMAESGGWVERPEAEIGHIEQGKVYGNGF